MTTRERISKAYVNRQQLAVPTTMIRFSRESYLFMMRKWILYYFVALG